MSFRREIVLSTACCALAVNLTAATATAQGPAPSAAPASSEVPSPPPDPHSEARAHFEKGNALFKEGALTAALAEFLASRKLHPTKSATSNAALCLSRLQRFDEALDLVEALLKDYPDLPDDLKAQAQREVMRLRGLVGTIDIAGAEPGAVITIDGRSRGEVPALVALRVSAGSHLVRVSKTGFEPFEARIEVAGGQLARVEARLHALTRSGRLHVTEQGGKVLLVVVDGSVVGKTPWDGQLAVGDHVVLLRGEGDLGTPPASVSIGVDKTTSLTLSAEALTAQLRVEPVPVNASVAIDAVTIGRGVWEGRLRAGAHKIEVAAPGFVPSVMQVSIVRGEQRSLAVPLQRDPTSPFWPKPPRRPRFIAELGAAVALTPTFGGGVAGGCIDDCRLGVGVGASFVVRGGYELGSGPGFGVMAGYLTAGQAMSGRQTKVYPLGGLPADSGVVGDVLKLRGALVGAWAGWSIFTQVRIHFRVSGGALLGSVEDARTGQFAPGGAQLMLTGGQCHGQTADSPPKDVPCFPVGPVVEVHSARLFYLAPEVRVGLPLGRHVEVNLGIEVPILISPALVAWGPSSSRDKPDLINAGSDGAGAFAAEPLLGRALVLFAPSVGARYDF